MTHLSFRPGLPGLIPDAWIATPASAVRRPPVVVIHGIQRQAREMALLMKARASATGRCLVLPVFDSRQWKRYQRAVCRDRSDIALLRLLQVLQQEGRVAGGPVDLSGFSGGAQFAHRFAWLYPDMVGRLCLAAPGWWTFPYSATRWPYGMGASLQRGTLVSVALKANLPRFLDRDIVVCVGEQDTERDINLRAGPEIDAQQGVTRVERARRWCEAMQTASDARGLPRRVSFTLLPGCGHSLGDCVAEAGLDRYLIASHGPTERSGAGGARQSPRTTHLMETDAA